jgi:hypothetical protein
MLIFHAMAIMRGGLFAFIQGKAVERAQALAVAKAHRLSDKAVNKLEGQNKGADAALAAVTLSAAGERMEDAREEVAAAAAEGGGGVAVDEDAVAALAEEPANTLAQEATNLVEDEAAGAALAEEAALDEEEVVGVIDDDEAAALAEEAAALDDDEAAALDEENNDPGTEDGTTSALGTFKGALFDLIGYLQINASFALSMPEVPWPSSFSELSTSLSGAFNVNFATDLGSADCLLASSVCYRTLNTMLIAMGFLLALPLSQLIARGCRMHASKRRILADSATTIWLVLAMLAHAPLTNLILGCLQCEWFDDISVLKRDRALGCGEEPICLGTAGVFVPLFTIGFPMYMLSRLASFSTPWGQARLKRQYGEHYNATVAQYRRQFNFFVSKYEPKFWWYELSEMMRKLLLTSVAAFLDATKAPYSELVCKITISFFFFVLFVASSPKSDNLLDIIMATAQLCTFLTLMFALLLKIDFFEEEGVAPEAAGAVLLLIQVLPIAVSACCCVYAFGKEHGAKGIAVAQHVSGRISMWRRSKAKPSADSVVRGEDEKVQMTGGSISI